MYTPSSHLLPPEDMHPNSPVPLLYRLALTLSYTLSEKGCGLNSAAINWIKLNWHKVKPVVLSQCLAKSLCWNWERCFFSGVVACTTTQTYSSIFLFFFFFLLQGRHNPLAPGNWTVGKYLFQSGICLWAMWSKKKKNPMFWQDMTFLVKLMNFCWTRSQVWEVFFCNTNISLFACCWLDSVFCLFSRTFSAVQWSMSSCCISSCFFYVKKKRLLYCTMVITNLTNYYISCGY